MADELKLGAEAAAGARAEAIIGDPLFADAVRQIRDAIVSQWQAEEDAARRDRLWTEIRLLSRLVGRIRGVMETGKLAQAELGEIEARKGILQRMGLQK
jgi:hypothetical protein